MTETATKHQVALKHIKNSESSNVVESTQRHHLRIPNTMASIIDKAKEKLHVGKKGDDIVITGQKVHGTGYGLMGLTVSWKISNKT